MPPGDQYVVHTLKAYRAKAFGRLALIVRDLDAAVERWKDRRDA
jgi:hypothetical protein